MIIVDTRERKWDHVRAFFDRTDVRYEIHKLDYGDYMIPGGSVSVDRKQHLEELAANLCTKDQRRFWSELRNAKKHGIQLVILCEHGAKYKEPRDVIPWRSKYTNITGQQVFRAMFQAAAAYGVKFEFCEKRRTGRRIVEILEEYDGRKNRLDQDQQKDP